MSKWRANKNYRRYRIARYPAENNVLLDGQRESLNSCYLLGLIGKKYQPHERKPHRMVQFFHLFGPFQINSVYNAWNHRKNFHQDWGKNSLDVIGHTHTRGLCLSPVRHCGGVCGPSCGASQSVHSPLFSFFFSLLFSPPFSSLHRNAVQHGKSYLSQQLQRSHRPVKPIYLLREDELTLKQTSFSPPGADVAVQHVQRRRNVWELTFYLKCSSVESCQTMENIAMHHEITPNLFMQLYTTLQEGKIIIVGPFLFVLVCLMVLNNYKSSSAHIFFGFSLHGLGTNHENCLSCLMII